MSTGILWYIISLRCANKDTPRPTGIRGMAPLIPLKRGWLG